MTTRQTPSPAPEAPRSSKRRSRAARVRRQSEEWLALGAEYLRTVTSGSRATDERLALEGIRGLRFQLP